MNSRRLRALASTTCLCAVVGALGAPLPASAQDAGETASGGVEQIVVTARRREESLQDVPVAVSAFTSAALDRRRIETTTDLDMVTPSMQFTSYGQLSGNNSAAVVFIRGIGQLDPTPAVDPGVGIYIDDVYMGRAVGGALDFGDIESVQVLRGPQGTLFGRNTIGGAVLVATREPDDEFGGSARVRIGEDNLREVFAALNIPLGPGLAARVSAGGRQRDGYVTRTFDGQDLGDDNTYTLQGALRWEAAPNFTLSLRGDYTNEDENGSPFVFRGINETAPVPAIVSVAAGCPGATIPFAPLAPPDPRFGAPNVPVGTNDPRCANDFYDMGPFTNGGTAPVESTFEGGGFSARAEWEVSDTFTLRSITAYRNIEWTGIRDADNTPFTILTTDYMSESSQFSQELQALFDLDRLDGVVGFYYFDEETDDVLNIPLAFPPAPPVIGSLLAGGPGSRDRQFVNLTTESIALFTEWTFEVNDRLSLTGGLRYTDETKGMQAIIFNVLNAGNPDPNPLPTLATSEAGPLFIFSRPFEDSFTSLTGSAAVQYRWTDSFMTYLSYTQGFKSGGFNQRYNAPTADNRPVTFAEETVDTWEIGFKADLTDSFRLNVAAFMSDYEDIQLIYRQGVVPLLFNAGSASIDGFEVEFTYAPNADFIIEGGLSFLDDSIDSITPIPGATATVGPNNSLPFTPEWQANLGASYTFHFGNDLELTPGFNISYTDSQFFDAGNTVLTAQNDAVTVINGAVELARGDGLWSIELAVDNLTDELYPVQGNASFATLGYAEIIYARPRTWSLQLETEF